MTSAKLLALFSSAVSVEIIWSHRSLIMLRSRVGILHLQLSHLSNQSGDCGVISITIKIILQYGEKLHGVQEKQLSAQNTSLRHSRHHVNQFAPTTVHHDVQ